MNKDELIASCDLYVHKIAQEFRHICDYDDLLQAGRMGLVKAYENYKDNRDTQFSTYASWYIRGEMVSFINMNKTIKTNKDMYKLFKTYRKMNDLLTMKLERVVSHTEICEAMNVDEQLMNTALMSCSHTGSLDEENEENVSTYERIEDTKTTSIETKVMVDEMIESLEEPHRTIMIEKYLKDKSQSEIAEKLRMSQMNVSRKEREAKQRLRTYVA